MSWIGAYKKKDICYSRCMETIILFYKYTHLENPQAIKEWQLVLCNELGLTGRIVLAHEGINGTLAGHCEAIEEYCARMEAHASFGGIDFKTSPGTKSDFPRLQIKVKEEIVKMGVDPKKITARTGGKHLSPAQANKLIQDAPQELVILDARNNYESRIGAFKGALTPDIKHFRDFPHYVDTNQEQFKDKIVLMYCTGGIRCERASAYVKEVTSAQEVYQIEGGIHRYVEQFPQGFFKGKNYVFDARIASPVSEDILSTCDLCTTSCDTYANCINALCNKHFIVCSSCKDQYKNACSTRCKDGVLSGSLPRRPQGYRNQPQSSSCSIK